MAQEKIRLKKELTLLNVYAIATGTTLSAGFFLLPGLAFREAGPAVILSYLIAVIPLIPAMFSVLELATAMPRAGGAYYFLDRSMGPFVGTVGGLGTWLALIFKTAFALIGMGAYLGLFWKEAPLEIVAVAFAILFGMLNLFGAKKTGAFQTFLVAILLLILLLFIGKGLPAIETARLHGFFEKGTMSVLSTAGMVYISYVGVTNVASVAEEIRSPERNLPLGLFLAMLTAMLVYGLGTAVMVGVLPAGILEHDLTPVASAGERLMGNWGKFTLTLAAIAAFASVANAGILSASRYPLAMSRDHLIPRRFSSLTRRGMPLPAIVLTVTSIAGLVIALDVVSIAKLASTFQLLMFSLICLAVIVMRESRIEAYDPGYHTPWYPWMQIFGIFAPFWLIAEMGLLPILLTLGLLTVSTVWFLLYASPRVIRSGAVLHWFARLGEYRFEGLDRELRGIMKEKGLREEDPFDEVVTRADVMDLREELDFLQLVEQVSAKFAAMFQVHTDVVREGFMQGNRFGATPVDKGAALPHMRLPGIKQAEMILVRSISGSRFIQSSQLRNNDEGELIHAFFFFISPNENPGQHLRILAQIAGRVDGKDFMHEWLAAENEQELKEVLLRDERFLSLRLRENHKSVALIGKSLRELHMPEGSLVALIRRKGESIVPHGHTILHAGDRLTIIGDARGIMELSAEYGETAEIWKPRESG